MIKETLVEENGMIYYYVEYDPEKLDTCFDFNVYEVSGWDSKNNPVDEEIAMRGFIKWDGCSHFWFGEDGYMHLCGKEYVQRLVTVLNGLWECASTKIKNYDKEVAE